MLGNFSFGVFSSEIFPIGVSISRLSRGTSEEKDMEFIDNVELLAACFHFGRQISFEPSQYRKFAIAWTTEDTIRLLEGLAPNGFVC